MEKIKSFHEDVRILGNKMRQAISRFFQYNPKVEIDIVEIDGGEIVVMGDSIVDTITANGVSGSSREFTFDVLDHVDLDYIIGIINAYVDQTEKAMERAKR